MDSKFVIPQATNSKFFILHPAYSTYSRVIDKFLFHLRSFASKELISVFVSLINSKRQCILREVIYGIVRQLMLSLLFFFVPLFTSTAISHWRVDFLIVSILLFFIATVKRSTKTCKMLLRVLSWPKSWPG